MGRVDIFGKWDTVKNNWYKPTDIIKGRSFSFGTYGYTINNPNKGFNYIIVANGSRLDQNSKDNIYIDEKQLNVKHILDYYKNKDGNYIIKLFLMDTDAPIKEDAKYMAKYIDVLASLATTNSINIIGLSKCGTMNFYIPSFFKNRLSYKKTNILSVAAPYLGTKLASPSIIYPEVKNLINNKLGDNQLSQKIYNKIISLYESISSSSHMDYDIAIPGEVPDCKKNLYDQSFIENIFLNSNIKAMENVNSFTNFTTGIDNETLHKCIKTHSYSGIALCISNDLFFNGKSDGMVYTEDQRAVEKVLGTKSIHLKSAHHDVFNNNEAYDQILHKCDDIIAGSDEKRLYNLNRKISI